MPLSAFRMPRQTECRIIGGGRVQGRDDDTNDVRAYDLMLGQENLKFMNLN